MKVSDVTQPLSQVWQAPTETARVVASQLWEWTPRIAPSAASLAAATFALSYVWRCRAQNRESISNEAEETLREPLMRYNERIVLFYNRKANRNMGATIAEWLPRFLGPSLATFPLDPDGVDSGILAIRDMLRKYDKNTSDTPISSVHCTDASLRLQVRIIVAGGDGSVGWILQRLAHEGLSQVPVGVIPLGTGNDMSYVLGWGACAPDMYRFLTYDGVKHWLREIRSATVSPTDIWHISFGVHKEQGGRIIKVQAGRASPTNTASEQCLCINYASLGLDAKLVYAVEIQRTGFRFLNKIVYFLAGCFNSMLPTTPVSTMIASLKLNGTPIDPFAVGSYQSLIAMNVPSYAGGVPLWKIAQSLDKPFYERLFLRAENAEPDPVVPLPVMKPDTASLSTGGMPSMTQSVSTHTTSMSNTTRASTKQSLSTSSRAMNDNQVETETLHSDGQLRLVGGKTLTQLGAAVGVQFPIFGGVHKIATTHEIFIEFLTDVSGPIYLQVDGEVYVLEKPQYFSMRLQQRGRVLKRRLPAACAFYPE